MSISRGLNTESLSVWSLLKYEPAKCLSLGDAKEFLASLLRILFLPAAGTPLKVLPGNQRKRAGGTLSPRRGLRPSLSKSCSSSAL